MAISYNPKAKMRYLMLPGKMEGKYLGACLDGCRWGSPTTVMWETDVRGLMDFIQKWREENRDDIKLYHEVPVDERYKKFELPYISHKHCPRGEEHSGTFLDGAKRIRCAQRTINKLRPGFVVEYDAGFDELSQMQVRGIFENEPIDPTNYDDDGIDLTVPEQWERYLMELEIFKREKPSLEVIDVCYAILDDKAVVMPFESVLKRLNLNKNSRVKEVVFPFDGRSLAYYLQRWREQSADPPWFAET